MFPENNCRLNWEVILQKCFFSPTSFLHSGFQKERPLVMSFFPSVFFFFSLWVTCKVRYIYAHNQSVLVQEIKDQMPWCWGDKLMDYNFEGS